MSVVEVTVRQSDDLTTQDIHEIIVEVISGIRPRGCESCGLGGIDLVIRGGDPELFKQLARVSANKNVLSVGQVERSGEADG